MTEERGRASQLDMGVPHIARVYDHWLGGKDNYAADREVAEAIRAANPSVTENVRANRGFLRRAVRFLTAEEGIRQFLDIGTGLPSANNTHEVAQGIAPETRVVYVDNDPIVLVHAHALLTSSAEGRTAYLDADARDTQKILETAGAVLDFTRPVGVMMVGLMHCIPDEDDPAGLVRSVMDAVPEGSLLALSQPAVDIHAKAMSQVSSLMNQLMPKRITYRTQEQVTAFFDGLELLEPGVVPASLWRPDPDETPAPRSVWAGVARKS
jgi:S-adenosyl methyltransferase